MLRIRVLFNPRRRQAMLLNARPLVLYLDQIFSPQCIVEEILDLQLPAIPYSRIHEDESDFAGERRNVMRCVYQFMIGMAIIR